MPRPAFAGNWTVPAPPEAEQKPEPKPQPKPTPKPMLRLVTNDDLRNTGNLKAEWDRASGDYLYAVFHGASREALRMLAERVYKAKDRLKGWG